MILLIIRENTSTFDPRKIPGSTRHPKRSSQKGNMIAWLEDRSLILSDFTRSFFTDSKSRKTCADPKKCRQDRYEYGGHIKSKSAGPQRLLIPGGRSRVWFYRQYQLHTSNG